MENIEKYFDRAFMNIFDENPVHLLIGVLYTGSKHPDYCYPMPLDPTPAVDISVKNLLKIYKESLKINDAIRDGAIMIQISSDVSETPKITGWSYRMWPPPLKINRQKNRGSGYNSSLDFSGVKNVQAVYLVNSKEVLKFKKGIETIIYSEHDL